MLGHVSIYHILCDLTELSYLVFSEIPFSSIETAVVVLCKNVVTLDILYNWNGLFTSVLQPFLLAN